MKKPTILFPILIAIILVSLFLLINNLIKLTSPPSKNDSPETNLANQGNESSRDNQEEQTEEDNQNSPAESGSGSGAGGSGGGSSNSGSASTTNQCPQISYALKNFMKNSICLAYSNNICISKKVDCSVEVHNLDNEISDQFTIKIVLQELENQNTLQEFTLSNTISSQGYKVFEKSITFEGQSPEGDANKNYTCFFSTQEVPKKEIC